MPVQCTDRQAPISSMIAAKIDSLGDLSSICSKDVKNIGNKNHKTKEMVKGTSGMNDLMRSVRDVPRDDIVNGVCAVLDRLMTNNELVFCHPVSCFDAAQPMSVSVKGLLEHILESGLCSKECFIIALVYGQRLLQKKPDFLISKKNVHNLLLVSTMVASKVLDDFYCRNVYYAMAGGITSSVLNNMELSFCFMLDFDLHISVEEFSLHCESLRREPLTPVIVTPPGVWGVGVFGAKHAPSPFADELPQYGVSYVPGHDLRYSGAHYGDVTVAMAGPMPVPIPLAAAPWMYAKPGAAVYAGERAVSLPSVRALWPVFPRPGEYGSAGVCDDGTPQQFPFWDSHDTQASGYSSSTVWKPSYGLPMPVRSDYVLPQEGPPVMSAPLPRAAPSRGTVACACAWPSGMYACFAGHDGGEYGSRSVWPAQDDPLGAAAAWFGTTSVARHSVPPV